MATKATQVIMAIVDIVFLDKESMDTTIIIITKRSMVVIIITMGIIKIIITIIITSAITDTIIAVMTMKIMFIITTEVRTTPIMKILPLTNAGTPPSNSIRMVVWSLTINTTVVKFITMLIYTARILIISSTVTTQHDAIV
jgi:hypothetical protein